MKIIKRLKELRAKATPGPWSVGPNTIGPDVVVESNEYVGPVSDDDAHLIVAAINALDYLTEVAQQAKILADAIDELEHAVSVVCGKTPESGMLTKPIRDALANLEG